MTVSCMGVSQALWSCRLLPGRREEAAIIIIIIIRHIMREDARRWRGAARVLGGRLAVVLLLT